MPYSLVTPHFPRVCRPVLLLPTILGHILSKKMADWQGFQLCEPGEEDRDTPVGSVDEEEEGEEEGGSVAADRKSDVVCVSVR